MGWVHQCYWHSQPKPILIPTAGQHTEGTMAQAQETVRGPQELALHGVTTLPSAWPAQ